MRNEEHGVTHHAVTARETAELQKIAARRKWLVLGAQCTILLALLAIASRRALGERYDTLSLLFGSAFLLATIGIFVYLTCFQRCPRCAGWIVIPKCPGCGLKL